MSVMADIGLLGMPNASGPPSGIYFSLRKPKHPAPPLPASIRIDAESTNPVIELAND
jgi:hypothetical protein